MGIGIGTTTRAIVSLTPVGFTQPVRSVAPSSNSEKPGQLVRPEEAPEVEAGFGENTLSPSGAALKALDSNLKAAAQLVPTVEELRERARAAQAQREDAAAREAQPVEFRRREAVLPEASPAVRNFFQDAPKPVDTEEPSTTEPATQGSEESDAVQLSASQAQAPAQPQPSPPGSRLNLQA